MRTCECGIKIPDKARIDNRIRNLRNRTKCLNCQPFGSSPYSRRYLPEERKNIQRQIRNKKQAKWRDRKIQIDGVDPISTFRKTRKNLIVKAIGGSCGLCGYKKSQRNLVFHHLGNKVFSLTERSFQRCWEVLIPEIIKCILVCHNCHGEIHDNLISQELIQQLNNNLRQKYQIVIFELRVLKYNCYFFLGS